MGEGASVAFGLHLVCVCVIDVVESFLCLRSFAIGVGVTEMAHTSCE